MKKLFLILTLLATTAMAQHATHHQASINPSDPGFGEQSAASDSIADHTSCAPKIPKGFFRFEDGGYYANENGAYCRLASFPQWRKAGGPEDVNSVVRVHRIPKVMINHGTCAYREFFLSAGIGYYGNDQGHYCRFETWDQWLSHGGPSNPAIIEEYAIIPQSMIYDGVCQ